jgi:hypothetical protein
MTQTAHVLPSCDRYSPATAEAAPKVHRAPLRPSDGLLARNHAANCDRIAAFLSLPGIAEMAARDWADLRVTKGPRYNAPATKSCAIPWCERSARNGTLCAAHAHRQARHGDPLLCKAKRTSNGARLLCREVGIDAAGEMILEEVEG